jgi:hypothetical protein
MGIEGEAEIDVLQSNVYGDVDVSSFVGWETRTSMARMAYSLATCSSRQRDSRSRVGMRR